MLHLAACSDYEVSGKPRDADPFDSSTDWETPEDTGETDIPPEDSGNCEGMGAPDPYTVAPNEACINEPTIGSFSPVVEWQWNANPIHSGYDDIMASPVVGNLTDDDLDGDVDEDDIPDICFTSFSGGAYTSAGTLTCISGDSGLTHWSTTGAGGYGIYSSGGVAIGDLEGDGSPEVCVAATNASVLCLNADSSFKWAGGDEPGYVACPAIADMDGDGNAEVVVGRHIFAANGTLLGKGAYGMGSSYQMSFPVDMDGDGLLEVVAGNAVYRIDGSLLWYNGLSDAIPAVGDFDADGVPEVVQAGGGSVFLFNNDGSVRWTTSVYGGGSGGAPTIADFDGDGAPEIGVAGAAYYTVYEGDGSVRWANAVSDYSSNVTGSSVFDFEGDGAAEVVYADEHTLWIYDGATGAVEMAESGHASGTLFEYPLVADVDRDGSTEIVLASNNYGYSGWNGITVIGDAASSWAPARPIWNQFAYHITNVENNGSIPAVQVENWLTWNNFRAGGTELGPSHWLADLAPGDDRICVDECWDNKVVMYVAVENAGLLAGKDVSVRFVREDGTVSVEEIVPLLGSGAGEILGPFTLARADWGPGILTMTVDTPDAIAECDETDNARELGEWPCEASPP